MLDAATKERIDLEVRRGTDDPLPYYCVSTAKFVLLSLLTWGLYELYWFYKNWKQVRDITGRPVIPIGRAIFAIFYCHSLAGAVRSTARSLNLAESFQPSAVAAGYALLILLQSLPDPWWLVSLFSFVPLMPIAVTIREIHGAMRPGFEDTVGWGLPSYAAATLGCAFTVLVVAGTLGPPTHAIPRAEMPVAYLETLREAGVLEPGEEVDYFYSAGLLSILEDGNLLTRDRVISYYSESGELLVASATYAEVAGHEVTFSESEFEDSVLWITTTDGIEFSLLVSSEQGRDHEFVSLLESRLAY